LRPRQSKSGLETETSRPRLHPWVNALTFLGDMTSSIMWPFDSQVAISYRCSIVTKSVSPAVVEIMGPKYIGSWPWPFWVTWRHQSRAHSNPNGLFPIGGPLDPSLYL